LWYHTGPSGVKGYHPGALSTWRGAVSGADGGALKITEFPLSLLEGGGGEGPPDTRAHRQPRGYRPRAYWALAAPRHPCTRSLRPPPGRTRRDLAEKCPKLEHTGARRPNTPLVIGRCGCAARPHEGRGEAHNET